MSGYDRNSRIFTSTAGTTYKNPVYEIHLFAICTVHGARRLVVANFKDYETSLHQYTN